MTAAGTEAGAPAKAKAKKKKPPPLLPPEETVKAPAPKLGWKDRLKRGFAGKTAKIAANNPLATPPISVDIVNEQLEVGRVDRALKRLTRQAVAIAIFACALAVGAPFFAPLYVYHTITPEGRTALLVPLEMPNLTNPAIVSWAATSATEILSFGFGDVEAKTILQKQRFTTGGWAAFVKAFMNSKISETFKKSQMVMTTVPTDTPVILAQGVNEEGVYQWKVEVPIITTYAANNNVIKPERATIEMTIIRVPHDQSPVGIAIDIWRHIKH